MNPSSEPPRVSVVIVFLNAARFLPESVQSVFEQTFRGWELVLVDDGSTDGSAAWARALAAAHPGRVRYVEHADHANRGISASRNLGVHRARGTYIALLDADDTWVASKLEEQVAIAEAHPDAAMVLGNMLFWHSWSRRAQDMDTLIEPRFAVDRLYQPPEFLDLYFTPEAQVVVGMSDLLFRPRLVALVNGFEEAFVGMYEDRVFLTKVFATAPVFVSSACWTRYRQHDGSCVAQWRNGASPDAVEQVVDWSRDYLKREGLTRGRAWTALRRMHFQLKHPFLGRLSRAVTRQRASQP